MDNFNDEDQAHVLKIQAAARGRAGRKRVTNLRNPKVRRCRLTLSNPR